MVVFVILCLIGTSLGCDTDTTRPVASSGAVEQSVGELHNQFLTRLYNRFGAQRRLSAGSLAPAVEQQLVTDVANEMLTEYGEPTMTAKEVVAAVQEGRAMAQQDPEMLVRSALTEQELIWWDRFASEATPETAADVYADQVKRYGAPGPGSILAEMVDIAVHSSEFWVIVHADDEPIGPGQRTSVPSSWKKRVLRFTVIVATDGVAGGLAGAGGGGVVGGAIVGGLASYGADCLLFGCQ